jgi:hypothetical protein
LSPAIGGKKFGCTAVGDRLWAKANRIFFCRGDFFLFVKTEGEEGKYIRGFAPYAPTSFFAIAAKALCLHKKASGRLLV